MNTDVYTLPEGDVTLQWPKELTQDSYAELEDWLDLIKRKAKRAVVTEKGPREDSGI